MGFIIVGFCCSTYQNDKGIYQYIHLYRVHVGCFVHPCSQSLKCNQPGTLSNWTIRSTAAQGEKDDEHAVKCLSTRTLHLHHWPMPTWSFTASTTLVVSFTSFSALLREDECLGKYWAERKEKVKGGGETASKSKWKGSLAGCCSPDNIGRKEDSCEKELPTKRSHGAPHCCQKRRGDKHMSSATADATTKKSSVGEAETSDHATHRGAWGHFSSCKEPGPGAPCHLSAGGASWWALYRLQWG